jgi:hypothetical protein
MDADPTGAVVTLDEHRSPASKVAGLLGLDPVAAPNGGSGAAW